MPLYPWKCKHCGAKSEVLRSFSEYSNPPSQEEIEKEPGQELTEEQKSCNHEMERIISSSPFVFTGAPFR